MTDTEKDALISSLFMALQQSPPMVNPEGDRALLESLARQYTRWAVGVRNKLLFDSGEAVKDLWLPVAQAVSEKRAYGLLENNLAPFALVDTYRGDTVRVRVTHRDGTVEESDGSWLVSAAYTLCD
jgi:hypothetical protein